MSLSMNDITIRRLATVTPAQVQALVDVLHDIVDGNDSVGFMQPFDEAEALAFWRRVADGVARGARALLVAEDVSGIVGTVQLVLEQPANQPHRADVSKMLVLRRVRRRGIGASLMSALESVAREQGKTVLVLDTASADAERVYTQLGWQLVGMVPRFALFPDGSYCSTSFFYRELATRPRPSPLPVGEEAVRAS